MYVLLLYVHMCMCGTLCIYGLQPCMCCRCSIDESRQAQLKRWRTGTNITQHHNHLDLANNIGSVFFALVAALTRFPRSLFESTNGRLVGVNPCVPALRTCSCLFVCLSSRDMLGRGSRFCVSCRVWDACAAHGGHCSCSSSSIIGEC